MNATTSTKRTDIHRPSEMDPADYSEVLVFAGATANEPAFNIDRLIELRKRETFFRKPNGKGGCDVCGANFRFGSVFVHVPTREHILVGHDCATKIGLLGDRAAWEEVREMAKKQSLRRRERRARWEAYRAALTNEPRLRKLFRVDHRIIADIRERFRSSPFRCVPSAKQVDFMERLAREVNEPAVIEKKVPAPVGRVDFEGVVVSVRTSENDFGSRLVITVKVETPDGRWLVWGTAPANVIDDAVKAADAEFRAVQDKAAAIIAEKGAEGAEEAKALADEFYRTRTESPLKGRRVSIKATLEQSSKDPSFAFMKRPNGRVIG